MTTGGLEQGSSLEGITNLSHLHGFPMGSMGADGAATGADWSWIWNLETVAPRSLQRRRNNTTHTPQAAEQAVKTPQLHPEMVEAPAPGVPAGFPSSSGPKPFRHCPTISVRWRVWVARREEEIGKMRGCVSRVNGRNSCKRREISFPAAASGRDSASSKEWTNETWTSRSSGVFAAGAVSVRLAFDASSGRGFT